MSRTITTLLAAWMLALPIWNVEGADRRRSKEPPKEIEVFRDGALPDRTYKELDVFTDDITEAEEPEITKKIKKKAEKLKADGLIVHPLKPSGMSVVPFTGFRQSYLYRATAISFTGPPGSAPRLPEPAATERPASSSAGPKPQLSGSGTGFFITPDGYLITNEHVVKGAVLVRVRVADTFYEARVIRVDRGTDLALLKAEGQFTALPIRSSKTVKLGDPIITVGYPRPDSQGAEPKLTRGDISSLAGMKDDPRAFQISNPIQPGNSGGAVLDRSGNAVGVVVSGLSDTFFLRRDGTVPQNVNYAIKSSFLNAFLDSVPSLPADGLPQPQSAELDQAQLVERAVAASVMVLTYQ